MASKTCKKAKRPVDEYCLNCQNPRRKLKCSFAVSDSIHIANTTGTEIDFAQTIPAKRRPQPIQKFTPELIPGWKQPPLSEKAQRRGSQEVEKILSGKSDELEIENIAAYKVEMLAQKAAVYKQERDEAIKLLKTHNISAPSKK